MGRGAHNFVCLIPAAPRGPHLAVWAQPDAGEARRLICGCGPSRHKVSPDSWSSCTAPGRPRSPELDRRQSWTRGPLAPSPPEISPLVAGPRVPLCGFGCQSLRAGPVQVPTALPRVAEATALNGTRTNVCQSTSSRMAVSSSVRLSKQDCFVAMAVDSTQGCMLLCRAFRIQPRFLYVAMT